MNKIINGKHIGQTLVLKLSNNLTNFRVKNHGKNIFENIKRKAKSEFKIMGTT